MATVQPDDLLDYAGISSLATTRGRNLTRSSLRAYRASGRLPAPDDLSVPDRPRWRRDTIEAWLSIPLRQGRRTDLEKAADRP